MNSDEYFELLGNLQGRSASRAGAPDSSFFEVLVELNEHHRQSCGEYQDIVRLIFKNEKPTSFETFPYLPVRLFKELRLRSVPEPEIVRELYSSGTTGMTRSRILLDAKTSQVQRQVLSQVMQPFLGSQRLPMLILDSRSEVGQKDSLSARAAGILGLMPLGRQHTFALSETMKLDLDGVAEFGQKYAGERVFLFGFTFVIWKHVLRELRERQEFLELRNGVLVHSGGWKKLEAEKVSREEFSESVTEVLGVPEVINFYGMVEQVGSVFLDCSEGNFHASEYSHIIIRDPITLEPVEVGQSGLIQSFSVLPWSYPGHSILTEDIGYVVHESGECPCGRLGIAFRVIGRIPKAEVRGCSDTVQG